MGLFEKTKEFILCQDLIREGDRVIAGVSGGADSVCLFLLLRRLLEEIPFFLSVLHVEHGIRGEESLQDAAFVRRLCKEKEIPCRVVHVDAPSYASAHGCSIEEAARDLRYSAFYQEKQRISEELPAKEKAEVRIRVAVAHNQDDQAETVIFHLIRGSSLKGLSGMECVQNDLIRPLLIARRVEIEKYLRQKKATWTEDVTNRDERFSRNRLRLRVMPALTELQPKAVEHIAETAQELSEVHSFLEELTAHAEELVLERDTHLFIKKKEWDALPGLLQNRVLYHALCEVCGSRKDITREHVEALRGLMENQSGRQLSLPYDVNAQRIYQGIRLVRLHTAAKRLTGSRSPLEMQKLIETRILDAVPNMQIPKKKYTKWFDYDKIKNGLQVRTRRSGDYLQITDDGARKTLKKYFIDEKIPGEERSYLPLLCDGDHVIWVIGYRVSACYKVTEETKHIIEVCYTGGQEG